jgi:methanogenic corrinoid protein MtbC1
MEEILLSLRNCIERGKINKKSPHPTDLQDQDGADELTLRAVELGLPIEKILHDGLIQAMYNVGERFRKKQIFVPDMLMSARAMLVSMEHLKPFYSSNHIKPRGKIIMGTVKGDLHDIGKKIVSMMITGAGWEVVDLGTDVTTEKFLNSLREHPSAIIGLSALLTTTMQNMETTVKEIKSFYPSTIIIIGGAPVTADFANRIGADAYGADPQGAVEFLNSLPMLN